MSEYEVIGGHDVAEFRRDGDEITVHSTEENPETGEEIGRVGSLSADELREAADTIESVMEGEVESATAPTFDEVAVRQMQTHPLAPPGVAFVALDEEGELDDSVGAVFDHDDVVEAAESL